MRRRRVLAVLGLALGGRIPVSAGADADALWPRLRSGGHVLLIRHASTDPGVGDPPGFRLGQCATQCKLSDRGRDEARALGAALARLTAWRSRDKGAGNIVLVSHDVNIRALTDQAVTPGGIVVGRMEGGALAVLGQLRLDVHPFSKE